MSSSSSHANNPLNALEACASRLFANRSAAEQYAAAQLYARPQWLPTAVPQPAAVFGSSFAPAPFDIAAYDMLCR